MGELPEEEEGGSCLVLITKSGVMIKFQPTFSGFGMNEHQLSWQCLIQSNQFGPSPLPVGFLNEWSGGLMLVSLVCKKPRKLSLPGFFESAWSRATALAQSRRARRNRRGEPTGRTPPGGRREEMLPVMVVVPAVPAVGAPGAMFHFCGVPAGPASIAVLYSNW